MTLKEKTCQATRPATYSRPLGPILKNTVKNQELEKIAECLEKATDIGEAILNSMHNKKLSFPDKFCLAIFLERYSDNSRSLSGLIKSLNLYPHIETSIGLILRCCLLDFIIINYLVIVAKTKGKASITKELYKLLFDNIANSVFVLKTYRDTKYLSKKDYKIRIDSLKSQCSNYLTALEIEDLESIPNRVKFPSPIKMFRKVQLDKEYKKNSYAFELYDWYSKYDHFGILSYALPRWSSTKNILRIKQSISYLLKGMAFTLILLEEQESSDKLLKLIDYLD